MHRVQRVAPHWEDSFVDGQGLPSASGWGAPCGSVSALARWALDRSPWRAGGPGPAGRPAGVSRHHDVLVRATPGAVLVWAHG
jgi:hypothetical protein